jgi:hypothetical protein
MTNHVIKQEEARKKKETERKRELDALEGSGNLAQNALKAMPDDAKEMKKRLELGAKKHRKDAAACATKRKAEREGTPQPLSNNARKKKAQTQTGGKTQEKDEPSQAVREVKTPRKDCPPQEAQATKKPKKVGPPQGTRKVPEAGDEYGCIHSGLLALLPLERKYLQICVKVGGWLHETPCFDCEKNEGGGDNRVLDVADLLNVKGRGGARRLLQLRSCGTQHDARGGTWSEGTVDVQHGPLHGLLQQPQHKNGGCQ